MALYKYHYIELDTKRSPRISLQNIVAGETGNRIWITVTNNGDVIDMSEKEDDEFIYRVALRIDSDLGTRRQDSDDPDGGITFIEANTGDHGKINILLSADSFTAGKNRCRLEIYSKRSEDDDTLICSAEWTFDAAGNPTGENAGNVYPSLILLENELHQLMTDAQDAIDDCEDATEAANNAVEAANDAADAMRSVVTDDLYSGDGNALVSVTKGETINLSGIAYANAKRARTGLYVRFAQGSSGTIVRQAVSLDSDDYLYAIALYDGTGDVSTGDGFIGYQDSANPYKDGPTKTVISAEASKFALVFKRSDEANITDADVAAILAAINIFSVTDKSLTLNGVPADAKTTGEKISRIEGAMFYFKAYEPNLESGRITDAGGKDSEWVNYRVRTKSLWNGHRSGHTERYAVSFTDTDYEFRVASYGANGSFGSDGTGVDFNGFLNNWGTGIVYLPNDCVKFALMFRKNGGNSQIHVNTDKDAIYAALTVQVVREAETDTGEYPKLDNEKKQDIVNLVNAYYAIKDNVVYNFTTTRNSYVTKAGTFNENNKLKACCTAFTQLIWGGVDPSTFADPDTYDGTIVKAFDWGYFLKFLIRQRTDGLAIRDGGVVTGEYGYRSPNGEEHGWSFNSRYDENGTWPNSQKPRTALNASDIACELYNNGYEVPLAKADVGDMIFYEEIPSGMTEYYSNAFRRIDHASIIIGKQQGFFEVAEVTSINGGYAPVVKRSIFSDNDFFAAKSGYMASRIVMVARHPAAYGVSGNVPSKFTSVSARTSY